MSSQIEETSIVESLQRIMTRGERILARGNVERNYIKVWHNAVTWQLVKVYGANSELLRRFSGLADGALLVSDASIGLQRLILFTSNILETLTVSVLANTQDAQTGKKISQDYKQ